MLAEARRNCSERGLDNTEFVTTDEFLASTGLRFDLVHSLIVFQHIEPRTGLEIVEKMLTSLTNNGIGVLHFTYAGSSAAFRVYRDHPLVYKLRNAVKAVRTSR